MLSHSNSNLISIHSVHGPHSNVCQFPKYPEMMQDLLQGGYDNHQDNHNNLKTSSLDDGCLRWESVRPITPTRPLLPCYHVAIISLCRCNFHLHNYYYPTLDGMRLRIIY